MLFLLHLMVGIPICLSTTIPFHHQNFRSQNLNFWVLQLVISCLTNAEKRELISMLFLLEDHLKVGIPLCLSTTIPFHHQNFGSQNLNFWVLQLVISCLTNAEKVPIFSSILLWIFTLIHLAG